MPPYQHFDTHKFMADPAFRAWVSSQQNGPPNPEAAAFWADWVMAHPEKSEAVQQAKEGLLAIWSEFDGLPESERLERVARIKTAQRLRADEPVVRSLGAGRAWWSAAAVAVVAGLGWLAYTYLPSQPPTGQPRRISYEQVVNQLADTHPTETTNPTPQPRRVALPDGSVLTLAANSKISYAPTLAQDAQRAVYLSGEAFFEVRRDVTRPFLVYANGTVTKVLGTSFRISAYENTPNVTVQVRTGRVSVFNSSRANNAGTLFRQLENGIVLTPNQQVVLRPDETLVKSIVPKPVLLHPEADRVGTVYTDVPLSDILDRLAASYGIEIVYDKATFRECLLTARLYDEPLLDQIGLLCKTVGATYTVADARILIAGAGCR